MGIYFERAIDAHLWNFTTMALKKQLIYPLAQIVLASGLMVTQALPGYAQAASEELPAVLPATPIAQPQPLPTATNATPTAIEEAYILGAGDQIQIDIFNVPELSGENGTYTVLVDGSLNLPWIGKVMVGGYTLQESADTIAARYAEYINEPLVTISLLAARPMRVAIVGEVNRPGAYTTGQGVGTGPAGLVEGQLRAGELRTVIEAIQTAGGITQMADIRNIEVHRSRLNAPADITRVDLWTFLQQGNLNQDITLRDGDTVVIPTATALNLQESQELAAASFSPDTINVNVVGEVNNPGLVAVSPNISLNQAILAAGGFNDPRARRADVELIRLNPDGTMSKQTIPVDFSAALNQETNPTLRSNDIVIVSQSGLSRTSDFLEVVESVAGSVLNPLGSVIDIIGDIFGN
ncbi:MAG: polysaccharide transporter [Leptolyngbyaceae cyanobacterium SL_7_1]|nr:polysaccharide transporter [Leptolyngbyaceae cyanobacterium SL_7_1]